MVPFLSLEEERKVGLFEFVGKGGSKPVACRDVELLAGTLGLDSL